MNYPEALDAARSLALQDRIRLVQELWDEIAVERSAVSLTEAQRSELDRRIAAYEADPSRVVPWEEVKAEAERRLTR